MNTNLFTKHNNPILLQNSIKIIMMQAEGKYGKLLLHWYLNLNLHNNQQRNKKCKYNM